jgi:hypothetical protein
MLSNLCQKSICSIRTFFSAVGRDPLSSVKRWNSWRPGIVYHAQRFEPADDIPRSHPGVSSILFVPIDGGDGVDRRQVRVAFPRQKTRIFRPEKVSTNIDFLEFPDSLLRCGSQARILSGSAMKSTTWKPRSLSVDTLLGC